MKHLLALTVVFVLCLLAVPPWVWAQVTSDTVDYINPETKKPEKVVGTIEEESPKGIKIKSGKDEKEIPALAITQVTYRNARVDAIEFRQGFTKEMRALEKTKTADRKAGLQEALVLFQKVAGNVRDNAAALRYMQFKMAMVQVELARNEPDNPALLQAALKALTEFKDGYTGGWQIVPVLLTLGRMQEEQGNLDAARAAFEALVALPDAPKELKREGEIQVALLLVRSKRYTEAEVKLKSLFQAAHPKDPQRGLLQIYLVEAQLAQNKLDQVEPALKAALAASGDNARVKAAAHNLLGDYYRAKKQDEDALWEYLKVEALYSQEQDEHAKALYYLSKLFQSVKGDRPRAQQCLDRLSEKTFSGSEYQRKALAEKK